MRAGRGAAPSEGAAGGMGRCGGEVGGEGGPEAGGRGHHQGGGGAVLPPEFVVPI